jgi:hypothetical protein
MNARHLSLSFAPLACLLILSSALAAGAPNFAGTWVLNTSKGKNLGMVAALQETAVIRQTPAQLTIEFSTTFQGKTTTRTVNYDLGGKPVQNEGPMGDKAETMAKWQGASLVVSWTSAGAVAGSTVVKTETRTLSADGKTMTVSSVRGSNAPMELVYERK